MSTRPHNPADEARQRRLDDAVAQQRARGYFDDGEDTGNTNDNEGGDAGANEGDDE
jgi:hypothetical protein